MRRLYGFPRQHACHPAYKSQLDSIALELAAKYGTAIAVEMLPEAALEICKLQLQAVAK